MSTSATGTLVAWSLPDYTIAPKEATHPFAAILGLGLLAQYPSGTKVGFDHQLQLQVPSIIQGAIRIYRGDNHEDLSLLKRSILIAAEWYPVDESSETGVEMQAIFKEAIKGLDALKITYPEGNTPDAIETWVLLINRICSGQIEAKFNPPEKQADLINRIKNIWDIADIKFVYEKLKKLRAEGIEEKTKMRLINEIETLLGSKTSLYQTMLDEEKQAKSQALQASQGKTKSRYVSAQKTITTTTSRPVSVEITSSITHDDETLLKKAETKPDEVDSLI